MEISKTLITPSMAKALLEKNISNRKVRELKVKQYAEEMLSGNWKSDTFEFIKISKTGKLIDGQHRLMAIIKAGIELPMQVAYNVPDDVKSVLDTGINRSTSDVFRIDGIKNATSLPPIIKTYNRFKNEKNSRNSVNYLTNMESLDEYYSNPEFWQMVFKKSKQWYEKFAMVISHSLIGGFYAYTYSIDENEAELFFDQLCGNVIVTNNTINLLRNTLIKDRVSTKKLPKEVIHIYLIKTWNAFRLNKELKILKWNPESESYPTTK